jgi:hypothetical protein
MDMWQVEVGLTVGSWGWGEQEAPLVSFVCDGHEQKLQLWKQDWQKLERWQRIQQIGQVPSLRTVPAVKVEERTETEPLSKLGVRNDHGFPNMIELWY